MYFYITHTYIHRIIHVPAQGDRFIRGQFKIRNHKKRTLKIPAVKFFPNNLSIFLIFLKTLTIKKINTTRNHFKFIFKIIEIIVERDSEKPRLKFCEKMIFKQKIIILIQKWYSALIISALVYNSVILWIL